MHLLQHVQTLPVPLAYANNTRPIILFLLPAKYAATLILLGAPHFTPPGANRVRA